MPCWLSISTASIRLKILFTALEGIANGVAQEYGYHRRAGRSRRGGASSGHSAVSGAPGAILERYGVPEEAVGPVSVIVDKMEKIPLEKVRYAAAHC